MWSTEFTVHCEHWAYSHQQRLQYKRHRGEEKSPPKVNFTLISGEREFKYHLIIRQCEDSYSKTILQGWMMNPHLRDHFVIVWKCSVPFSFSLSLSLMCFFFFLAVPSSVSPPSPRCSVLRCGTLCSPSESASRRTPCSCRWRWSRRSVGQRSPVAAGIPGREL